MGKEMIEVITSFNKRYYDLIGRDCVESWKQYWGDEFRLVCYTEEFKLKQSHPRIAKIDFDKLDPDYWAFQQDETLNQSQKKFAKKAYSFMHAMDHSQSDWIIWLDADVVTQQSTPYEVWQPLLDPNYLSVYMGVTYETDKSGNPGNWLVPETGVYAVNRRHPDFAVFRDEYVRRYHQRDYADLRRFYDNDVFGIAIRHQPWTPSLDLCAGFAKAYKTPLKHTVLGPYLHHYKAKHSKAFYEENIFYGDYWQEDDQ